MSKNRNRMVVSDTNAIDSATRGAMAELYASAFFLGEGYHVYRSVSKTGLHDLIIIKNNQIKTVQVTTGKLLESSGTLYHKKNISKCESDFLFVFHSSKSIFIDLESGNTRDVYLTKSVARQTHKLNKYDGLPRNNNGVLLWSPRFILGIKSILSVCPAKTDCHIQLDAWRKVFYFDKPGNTDNKRATFYRARMDLINMGCVKIIGNKVDINYKILQNFAINCGITEKGYTEDQKQGVTNSPITENTIETNICQQSDEA